MGNIPARRDVTKAYQWLQTHSILLYQWLFEMLIASLWNSNNSACVLPRADGRRQSETKAVFNLSRKHTVAIPCDTVIDMSERCIYPVWRDRRKSVFFPSVRLSLAINHCQWDAWMWTSSPLTAQTRAIPLWPLSFALATDAKRMAQPLLTLLCSYLPATEPDAPVGVAHCQKITHRAVAITTPALHIIYVCQQRWRRRDPSYPVH